MFTCQGRKILSLHSETQIRAQEVTKTKCLLLWWRGSEKDRCVWNNILCSMRSHCTTRESYGNTDTIGDCSVLNCKRRGLLPFALSADRKEGKETCPCLVLMESTFQLIWRHFWATAHGNNVTATTPDFHNRPKMLRASRAQPEPGERNAILKSTKVQTFRQLISLRT